MKKFNKEIQIAAVAILGVIVLYYGMQFLKGLTISSGSNYYVKFNDISGLSNSCPVYANGYKVGVVEDIIYDYDNQENIVAVLGVNNELHMPQGTKADIVSDFLGNIKLVLKLGDRAAGFLTPGDTIIGGQDQGALAKATEIIPQVQSLLPKLDSILVSVNALLADPAIANSLHNIDQITGSLTSTSRELNRPEQPHAADAGECRRYAGQCQQPDAESERAGPCLHDEQGGQHLAECGADDGQAEQQRGHPRTAHA